MLNASALIVRVRAQGLKLVSDPHKVGDGPVQLELVYPRGESSEDDADGRKDGAAGHVFVATMTKLEISLACLVFAWSLEDQDTLGELRFPIKRLRG